MESSDQKCGCGNRNDLISLQLKDPVNECGCKPADNRSNSTAKHYIIGTIQIKGGEISQISNLPPTGQNFAGEPPGYKRGDKGMTTIYAEL